MLQIMKKYTSEKEVYYRLRRFREKWDDVSEGIQEKNQLIWREVQCLQIVHPVEIIRRADPVHTVDHVRKQAAVKIVACLVIMERFFIRDKQDFAD